MATDQTSKRANKLVFDLKMTINEYLDRCDESNTPFICKLVSEDKNNKEQIEEFVLTLVFKNGMTIGQALSEQERVLDPNYITD